MGGEGFLQEPQRREAKWTLVHGVYGHVSVWFRKPASVDEVVTINIMPGWRRGTRITFPEKGHEQPGMVPADLVFVIDEKPHEVFVREGSDLVVRQAISLVDALTDFTLCVQTLDGRQLSIPVNEVVFPGYEKVVEREGMPGKDPSKRGALRVRFDVQFPTELTPEQKAGILELLPRQ